MSQLSPTQERFRNYVESMIRVAEPGLDLLLNVGDRVSRIVGRGDDPEPLAVPPPRANSIPRRHQGRAG
ncbi:MAG: hypothetical protein QOD76_1581 [Solirubrobacteraceae bacterium]|jgi:hypothetical protein|nr:hypothetical protein [Solirubrobacteraceae bacterium]